MTAVIYQWNNILGKILLNWENLWSYYIHYKCRSQVTQIIKEVFKQRSDFGSVQHSNLKLTHAYLKWVKSDPFPDNGKVCWGRVENKNLVTLTSAIFVCQYEDWWHDSSLWAMSEHLNVYWVVQVHSANTDLLWGQWRVNQGLFCFQCVVGVRKTPASGVWISARWWKPYLSYFGFNCKQLKAACCLSSHPSAFLFHFDIVDNTSQFEKIISWWLRFVTSHKRKMSFLHSKAVASWGEMETFIPTERTSSICKEPSKLSSFHEKAWLYIPQWFCGPACDDLPGRCNSCVGSCWPIISNGQKWNFFLLELGLLPNSIWQKHPICWTFAVFNLSRVRVRPLTASMFGFCHWELNIKWSCCSKQKHQSSPTGTAGKEGF